MRPKLKRAEMPIDLVMAIGLVWGHLTARQFEEAFLLAKGCLRVWPDDHNLILMQSYAAAEVLEPVDTGKLLAIKDPACQEWIRLVLRRAGLDSVNLPIERENARVRAATPNGKVTAIARPADPAPTPPRPPARQSGTDQETNP